MNRIRLALVIVLISFAVSAVAATRERNPWGEPFSTRQVSGDGYQATIFLPDSWSIDAEQRVLLPKDESLSGCRIRFDIYQDAVFQERLAAGIRRDREAATGAYESVLGRVGAAEAVWVRYTDGDGRRIARTYIDRSSDQGAATLVWQLEAPNGAANVCQRAFAAIAGESLVTPVESSGATPPR